jgi:predicted metal-dependent peptidase
MARRKEQVDPRYQSFVDGYGQVWQHPIFQAIADRRGGSAAASWREDLELTRGRGWARVHADGTIVVNRNAQLEPAEWAWVLAHCLLHLGFGHLEAGHSSDDATLAADCLTVTRFQRQLRIGTPPMYVPEGLPGSDDHRLAELWRVTGIPDGLGDLGCGGSAADHVPGVTDTKDLSWMDKLAVGLAAAAADAVNEAGQRRIAETDYNNPWEQARRWFVGSFPLLGALAAGFRIVADAGLARDWHIAIAAVDASAAEIYVNPLKSMAAGEYRFVLAHEMLHAALRHGERVGPRDPYLWNIAADFVVNGWLVEMGVGEMPEGCLYDPALKGRGAEDVYDEITKNLRRYRKLATLRGNGLGDMLSHGTPGAGEARRAGDLDDFYRRALIGGMIHHEQLGRGYLPSGLAEEIRVLQQPPPPWEVQLAQWFDRYFTPLERTRSYTRASRRQAATPDIPRAGWVRPQVEVRDRTFGVVLDTSGSMSAVLMGKALGAIASYAAARDVPAARVVFCDAAAYDAGYLAVEEIAGRVRVRGRGGTELQPGVRLLEQAVDFPADGPILIITDGQCDALRVRREHAYLMPRGARLPFSPRGDVFYLK